MVTATYYTDPACPWSWAAEPAIRKLMLDFGESLEWSYVMGGLARDWGEVVAAPGGTAGELVTGRLIRRWLQVADQTGTPLDPLLWVEAPIETTYPACMAVKAAAEQSPDSGYRYLRTLREAIMCHRRKLDHMEALVEEARRVRLDVERFRIGLRSHAITEAFGTDLESTKRLGEALAEVSVPIAGSAGEACSRGPGGAPLPSIAFGSEDGGERVVGGLRPYESYRDAVVECGAKPEPRTVSVEELVAHFGRVTTKEVELICGLAGPRASAELFRLAEQWRVRPVWCLTGYLWEAA